MHEDYELRVYQTVDIDSRTKYELILNGNCSEARFSLNWVSFWHRDHTTTTTFVKYRTSRRNSFDVDFNIDCHFYIVARTIIIWKANLQHTIWLI